MRHALLILTAGLACLLTACSGLNYGSPVPDARVQLRINTKLAEFVHFVPENSGNYVIANLDGYYLNGKRVMARQESDICGFAGVLVFIDYDHHYDAFDLCCPHCLNAKKPVTVDGIFATCPTCGEAFDLSYGTAHPTKGISRQGLKRYAVLYSGDIVNVGN